MRLGGVGWGGVGWGGVCDVCVMCTTFAPSYLEIKGWCAFKDRNTRGLTEGQAREFITKLRQGIGSDLDRLIARVGAMRVRNTKIICYLKNPSVSNCKQIREAMCAYIEKENIKLGGVTPYVIEEKPVWRQEQQRTFGKALGGTLSSTHTASPRLLVAPRPPSPSRPTPLVLVGVLATSVAVASAKPPSAPCGGKSDVLSSMLCASSAGVALLIVGLVLGTCTLPRVIQRTWWTMSFPAFPAQDVGFLWRCWRWPWRGGQFGNSVDAEKPNKSCYDPRNWLREVEFIMLERVQWSCVDHSNVNWSCSQHVCMKPPLVVIFTLFCVRQTHWTCGRTH